MLGVIAIVCVFPGLFALTTVFERKGLGRIQNRLGPNRVGPFGLFQPVADGIKSLTKEDIVPLSADAVVHFLAPLVLVVAVFMGFAVLPMGRNMVLVDMDAGLLFFFAMGAATELSVFMAGWSSRNKYSLLGAMRAVAQMISYEVRAAALERGRGHDHRLALAAEDRRGAEPVHRGLSALVHLHAVGPGGFRDVCHRRHGGDQPLALRSARRRVGAGGRLLTPNTPASNSRSSSSANTWPCSPSPAWAPRCFSADGRRRFRSSTGFRRGSGSSRKVMLSIFVFIWMRGTLPRLRQDQLMNFAWKFVLPFTLLNLLVTALWRFMGEGWLRWVVCTVDSRRRLTSSWAGWRCAASTSGRRSYRYAE